MVKVAFCGEIELLDGDFPSWLHRCAETVGIECCLDEYDGPLNLIDACAKALADEPYDLVVCAVDLMGISGIHAVSELSDLHSAQGDLKMVLCAKSAEHAYDAQVLGVDGYLIEPVSRADFDRVMGRNMRDIARLHGQSTIVSCRDGARRVPFSKLSYVETSGHDQVLHYLDHIDKCSMRGSSGDLFAILEGDERFFKVGSSHIVNLDHVAQFDTKNGMAVLTDGMKIPVPMRNRKALEQALYEHGRVIL